MNIKCYCPTIACPLGFDAMLEAFLLGGSHLRGKKKQGGDFDIEIPCTWMRRASVVLSSLVKDFLALAMENIVGNAVVASVTRAFY